MDQQQQHVLNQHVASPPPAHAGAVNMTETALSGAAGHVQIHTGPEVQQHNHARLGDGQPISEIRDGQIHVLCGDTPAAAAANADSNQPAHSHGRPHHGCGHHVHHTADGGAVSDPPKDFQHDGTTYAEGASGSNFVDAEKAGKPGLSTRIKEAIPGTKEHKARAEEQGSLAVYM